ncbi:MAG: hypothetical protein P8179_18600 [Candidatus Thiodiazotropha sp.]
MKAQHVAQWVQGHPLKPAHVDCATAVMLKILDGKCKMTEDDKSFMTLLYDAVKQCQGALLGDDIHHLIADARDRLNDERRNSLYEKRVLAETMISRPVMKGFKTMIREQGLFDLL